MFISEEYLRSLEITDKVLKEFQHKLFKLSDKTAYNIYLWFQECYYPETEEEGFEMFRKFLERFLETEDVSKEDEKIIKEIIKEVR